MTLGIKYLRVMAGQKTLLQGKSGGEMIWESRLSDGGLKNVEFETVCTLTLLLGKNRQKYRNITGIGTGFCSTRR